MMRTQQGERQEPGAPPSQARAPCMGGRWQVLQGPAAGFGEDSPKPMGSLELAPAGVDLSSPACQASRLHPL